MLRKTLTSPRVLAKYSLSIDLNTVDVTQININPDAMTAGIHYQIGALVDDELDVGIDSRIALNETETQWLLNQIQAAIWTALKAKVTLPTD